MVLRGVSFALEGGTIAAVLGPNGGGKTTLFRALLGDLPVRAARWSSTARPAYVPQTDRTRLDFPVSALDVVLMGAYGRTPAWRRVARADREAARAALDRVGLADRARRRFGALSGGQRQRVLIARALLQDSPVLLLDEPLSGVDAASAVRIEGVFQELRGEGRVLLVATHDVEQARRWDRVVCLNGEQIAVGARTRCSPPTSCGARTGPSWWCSRAASARSRSSTTSTDARVADRPVRRRPDAARAGRGADPGARVRAARRVGAALPAELRGRVALARDAARARDRRPGGAPLLLGAAGGVVAAAVAIALAGRDERLGGDVGVAVAITALFGLGALLALSPEVPARLGELLFGDLLGVTGRDLAEAAVLAGGVALALALGHRRLALSAFDRAAAPSLGVRPGRWELVLLVLLAVCTVAAVRGLGNLLVVAMILAPAAAALNVAARLPVALPLAALLAAAGRGARADRLLPLRGGGGRIGRAGCRHGVPRSVPGPSTLGRP